MNRLKKLILAKCNVLLGGLLSLLGFSGCHGEDPFNYVCLYGQPYAKYNIKGEVLDDEGSKLDGMKVIAKEVFHQDDREFARELGKTETDAKGQYFHKGDWNGYPDDCSIRIVVEDPKGVYAADSADVKLSHTSEGKNDWCLGTDEGTADFRLKRLEHIE